MDLPDHGDLGHRRGDDGAGENAAGILSRQVRPGIGSRAGFFPGVQSSYPVALVCVGIARPLLAIFFVATPVAQIISPKISYALLVIGTPGHAAILGMHGWQWLYIFWGIPAVICGILVLALLPDHPRDARWLSADEKIGLDDELRRESEPLGS